MSDEAKNGEAAAEAAAPEPQKIAILVLPDGRVNVSTTILNAAAFHRVLANAALAFNENANVQAAPVPVMDGLRLVTEEPKS